MTAEHKIYVKSANGSRKLKWTLKHSHADNHYLDCEVYSMAAAEMLGVRSLHLESQVTEAPQERSEQYAPEEEWIRQNESWLQEGG